MKKIYVHRPKKSDLLWDASVAVFKTKPTKTWQQAENCTWDYLWVSRNFGIKLQPGETKSYAIMELNFINLK